MKTYDVDNLQKMINNAINSQNHFWWGCIIGLQYGKLSEIRVYEDEELSYCVDTEEERERTFMPIVRVKYGSPYKGNSKTGYLVKWYDENHNPVNVSYLRNKPEPIIFETGASNFYLNSLILFTNNTSSLVDLRDKIYNNQKNDVELKPEIFIPLCDNARQTYLRELEYNGLEYRKINAMKYKKNYSDVLEYCNIYVNGFHHWNIDHS